MSQYKTVKAWILVKAYPQPSKLYQETVCCAAITEDGRLLRLYPIRYRLLNENQKFSRYDLIQCRIAKADIRDPRPESFKVDENSIEIITDTKNKRGKMALWQPYVVDGLVWLKEEQKKNKCSLGIIKPDVNSLRFYHKLAKKASEDEQDLLSTAHQVQTSLFEETLTPLEPPKYIFYYEFMIDGNKHNMQIHDWEVQATFYNYMKTYKDEETALSKMKDFYNVKICEMSPHFIMGNLGSRPYQFMIIGVLRSTENTSQGSLF